MLLVGGSVGDTHGSVHQAVGKDFSVTLDCLDGLLVAGRLYCLLQAATGLLVCDLSHDILVELSVRFKRGAIRLGYNLLVGIRGSNCLDNGSCLSA